MEIAQQELIKKNAELWTQQFNAIIDNLNEQLKDLQGFSGLKHVQWQRTEINSVMSDPQEEISAGNWDYIKVDDKLGAFILNIEFIDSEGKPDNWKLDTSPYVEIDELKEFADDLELDQKLSINNLWIEQIRSELEDNLDNFRQYWKSAPRLGKRREFVKGFLYHL